MAQMGKAKRSRNYAFTSFKIKTDLDKVWELGEGVFRYLLVGREICPKTGKKHLQGFAQFMSQRSLSSAQSVLGMGKIHMSVMRGTTKENITYCKKDGDFIEYGKPLGQGQRTDIENVKHYIDKNIMEGTFSDLQCWRNNFQTMLKYHKGFGRYRFLVEQREAKAWRNVKVTVLYGSTGSGKSRRLHEVSDYVIHGDQLKWWDGYDGELSIGIDEYANQIKLTELLGVIDGHPRRLPVKCSFAWARWIRVTMSSNLQPYEWHPQAKAEHKAALERRVDQWINMDDENMSVEGTDELSGN